MVFPFWSVVVVVRAVELAIFALAASTAFLNSSAETVLSDSTKESVTGTFSFWLDVLVAAIWSARPFLAVAMSDAVKPFGTAGLTRPASNCSLTLSMTVLASASTFAISAFKSVDAVKSFSTTRSGFSWTPASLAFWARVVSSMVLVFTVSPDVFPAW